jgi:hypothetical protein
MTNEHDRMLLNAIWYMMGIAPIEPVSNDVGIALSSLPPDEALVMKRKFRKIWRTLVKKRLGKSKVNKSATMKAFGLFPEEVGSTPPTRSQKLNRKRMVLNHVCQDILLPMKKLAKENISG